MPEVGTALGRNGRFPGVIRPKKECIKSCETCFAKNALNLNDKCPNLKLVCFTLSVWPSLRRSPHSSLNVTYCLILTAWQWWALPVFLCTLNPIKSHWGTGLRSFSSERLATFPPQADHVLVDLFSSREASGGGCSAGGAPQQYHTLPDVFLTHLLEGETGAS